MTSPRLRSAFALTLPLAVLALGAASSGCQLVVSFDRARISADGGGRADGGPSDAGPRDGGRDAGMDDAGMDDAGMVDGGMIDAGMIDAGMIDAGMMMADAGRDSGMMMADAGRDAGMTDAGMGVDGGRCAGVDCSGMDGMCVVGVCNPATGACGTMPRMDGTSCSDGSMCTTGDMCMTGACVPGTPRDCSAMDGMCVIGVCNSGTGACGTMPRMDGTACNDGSMCTTGDQCSGGACGGTAVDCSAMDSMCALGMCRASDGMCIAMPRMDGIACSDGMACTTGDACMTGMCASGPATVALAPLDDGAGAGGGVGIPNLVISEIAPGMHIELFNTTGSAIALSGVSHQLCAPFLYVTLSSLAPTVTVPAGGYAIVPWPSSFGATTAAAGEVMLYANGSFGDNTAILDYVCWGASPGGRLAQAMAISKWSGACAPALTGGAIHRIAMRAGDLATHYDTTSPPSPANMCVP